MASIAAKRLRKLEVATSAVEGNVAILTTASDGQRQPFPLTEY
jgi:hypothetical protein